VFSSLVIPFAKVSSPSKVGMAWMIKEYKINIGRVSEIKQEMEQTKMLYQLRVRLKFALMHNQANIRRLLLGRVAKT
jgi:hypothetical protein